MTECDERNSKQHDYSHNFWIGCHKFTEGCRNCYMFHAQRRRKLNPEEVKRVVTQWDAPLKVRRQRRKRESTKLSSLAAIRISLCRKLTSGGMRLGLSSVLRRI